MENRIEQHAALAGLLGKATFLILGESGRDDVIEIFRTVGKERGSRMAARALLDQEPLSYVNYMAYTEWAPEKEANQERDASPSRTYQGKSGAVTELSACPWYDAWKKYDLLAYGQLYCQEIDRALFSAFNKDFHMETSSALSRGDSSCTFLWQQELCPGDLQEIAEKKARFQNRYIRDFDYHTGHLLSVAERVLKERPGNGEKVLERAEEEFSRLFGKDTLDRARAAYPGEEL